MKTYAGNQRPVASIIINNYNYARFLKSSIDSALSQAYRPTEVIVVDDGSTDHSRQVILDYGDQLIPIFKGNGGQASALNAGFARSRGEIVIFLDADDVLLPQATEQVVAAFLSEPDSARVQYRMEVIDRQGRPTGIFKPASHLPMLDGDLRRHVLNFPFDIAWLPTSGNAFAVWVLRQLFPIPEQEFPILADFYLSHLSPLFGAVVSVEQVCAYYRVHGSNNYESSAPGINLDHIRRTVSYWGKTREYILRFAGRLNLAGRPGNEKDLLSVSYVAQRMVSLKLDPGCHPFQEDSLFRLLGLGARASLRRFDVSLPMKLLFLAWFLSVSLSPKPFARRLAELFLFPERRQQFNRVLAALHRAD